MTNLEWQKLEATVRQMTPSEKQRLIQLLTEAPRPVTQIRKNGTADNFLAELSKVTFEAPGLPDDFSRSDIYSDHD